MTTLTRIDTNGVISYNLTIDNSQVSVLTSYQTLDLLQTIEQLKSQIISDTTSTGVTPPIQDKKFHGIFAFSGPVSQQLEQNPSIAGTYLGYAWATCEPSQGTFDFSQIDKDMEPWIAQGKKVILRISCSGWKKWLTPNLPSWTPTWVYNQGVKQITEDDGSIKPAYWDNTFLTAYQKFISAFAAKYDGNKHVFAIELGIGDGGETKVDTRNNPNRLQLWQKIGYTDDLWLGAIKQIITFYTSSFKNTNLILLPDDSFIGGKYGMTTVLDLAVANNLWLQDNGLVKGEILRNQDWQKVLLVCEQRNKTKNSGDTLEEDLNQAVVNDKCIAVLCFVEDLLNPANAQTLLKYAAMAK